MSSDVIGRPTVRAYGAGKPKARPAQAAAIPLFDIFLYGVGIIAVVVVIVFMIKNHREAHGFNSAIREKHNLFNQIVGRIENELLRSALFLNRCSKDFLFGIEPKRLRVATTENLGSTALVQHDYVKTSDYSVPVHKGTGLATNQKMVLCNEHGTMEALIGSAMNDPNTDEIIWMETQTNLSSVLFADKPSLLADIQQVYYELVVDPKNENLLVLVRDDGNQRRVIARNVSRIRFRNLDDATSLEKEVRLAVEVSFKNDIEEATQFGLGQDLTFAREIRFRLMERVDPLIKNDIIKLIRQGV